MATIQAPTIASETIVTIAGFELRNTLVMAWLAMAVLCLLGMWAKSTGYKLIPGRVQAAFELVVEGLFDLFDSIMQNPRQTRMFFPMVATMFLFIITANWMGIFPGVGSITIPGMHDGHPMNIPLFRSMNADVNMTLVFAIVTIIVAQAAGITSLGILPHISKYIVPPWKNPIGTFVGLLELVSEFARVLSFTFRLFGNIFAGEVLLLVVSSLAPYLVPIPFLGLEIFVGFIQALVFAMLTLVFLKMAMTGHEHHDAPHGHAAAA